MLAFLGAPAPPAPARLARASEAAPALPAPPPEPAPSPGAAAAPPEEPVSGDPESLQAALLQIVSERTGYPPEMLDLDVNVEAELSNKV